jgi:hypothetical protein
MTTWTDIA